MDAIAIFLYVSQSFDPDWDLAYSELQKLNYEYDASLFTCKVK